MSSDAKLPVAQNRFDWVIRGLSSGPDNLFDEDLAAYDVAAIIPTLGAIVAEWLLVVPRTPCLSIAELDRANRESLLATADDVAARVSTWTEAWVTFEHGPGRKGSAIGCGVDQAHLHVVGGTLDLLDRLIEQVTELEWSAVDHSDPWSDIPTGSDYLVIRDRRRAFRALLSTPTSQRMRRALADTLGRRSEWDYRSHPNVANASRTKEMFRGAFSDAVA